MRHQTARTRDHHTREKRKVCIKNTLEAYQNSDGKTNDATVFLFQV